ncbi:MAG: exopolysaccharide biosynthesis protein [Parvibaculaceae bacterium]|jgi:hypothetical protein
MAKKRSGAIRGLASVGTRKNPHGSTIGDVLDGLGDRSFGWALLLVGLLNMLPLPPGSNLILGLPALFISAQMAVGKRTLWLPKFLVNRHLKRDRWRVAALNALPIARPLARLTRIRFSFLFEGKAERILGVLLVASAINLCLPIPLSAWLPAISFAVLGIGLVEHDGVIVALGALLAVTSILISLAIVIAVYLGVGYFAH